MKTYKKNIFKKLNEIYSKIPAIKCKNCGECCGAHVWFPVEAENIRNYLREHGIKERFAKSLFDTCPYLENNKCIIYPVRPVLCRLYGVVEDLKCSHVRVEKYLSKKEAEKIITSISELEYGG